MIIDASVAVKWFFPEDGSEQAIQLVANESLRAPQLLVTEVGNAIWKKLRRGEASEPIDILARFADLGRVIEIIDGRTSELAARALELALTLDHAIYDCMYLALAEADDDILITADDAFRRKVERAGMTRYVRTLAA